jgi:hypothetical protein
LRDTHGIISQKEIRQDYGRRIGILHHLVREKRRQATGGAEEHLAALALEHSVSAIELVTGEAIR